MNGQNYDLGSPRTDAFGAHRSSDTPRLHTRTTPYSRLANDRNALSSSSSGNGYGGNISPTKSSRALPSTRPGIPKSLSSSNLGQGMTRSSSETGLFAGIKSMFSRPMSWLATPSKSHQAQTHAVEQHGQKRDSGWDDEEAGSPTDQNRGAKRVRRRSPTPPTRGEYAPDLHSITGRAVTGFMLPPLPADISLKPKSKAGPALNFSRPLKSSQSMPYLDPPKDLLGSAKKRSALTRSKRVDMGTMATDDDDADVEMEKKDQWSPWKESHPGRTRASLTPARYTPMRNTESMDFGYPSASPFRVPASPSASRQPSGLARSATTSRLRRGSTAASDISMGRESLQGGSRSVMMNGDHDDRMSVDGNNREGSTLDWYMKDKWQGSPSAKAASVRLGSLAPSTSMPPIRKGQFVWDSEKGFVRENDLKSEAPQTVHKNDAEKILFALESMRKTPLTEARTSTSSFGSLPPDLVGSSSRSIRKAISVPLATAQAGESAKSRRDKERLGEGYNAVISPYGRRKIVERDERERRRERSRSELDNTHRPTHSPSRSVDTRSEVSSRSSNGMRSEASPTPSPAPTPRRSTRNKRKEEPVEEPTPRARKTKSKTEQEPAKPKERSSKRHTRRTTAERSHSPPPPAQNKEAPPPVPTIMETAPSPKHSHTSSTSTYQVRDDSGQREKSSLRAKSESKRQHQSAANSRATSPSGGRYSAREEDLPPMEELETAKISLPTGSFTGISFAPLNSAPSPTAAAPNAPTTAQTPVTPGTTSATPQSSLAVPSARAGPLSRLSSNRPRASSPLASGSIIAQPESPPEVRTSQPAAPAAAPDASGFFSLSGSATPTASSSANPPPLFSSIATNDMRTDGPKKAASFGLGKPSGAPNTDSPTAPPTFFFGNTTASASTPVQTAAIAAPAAFNFGLAKPDAKPEDKTAAPTFSFSVKPAENLSAGGSVFGGTPVNITPAASPAPTVSATTNGFSFGKPAKRSADTDSQDEPKRKAALSSFPTPATGSAKSGFSFGAPAETPSLDAPKSGFSFGQPATAPASAGNGTAPAAESSKPKFSFGQPAASAASDKAASKSVSFAPPAETPSLNGGGFSFGQPAATASKPFGGSATSAEGATAGVKPFTFGAPSGAPPAGSNLFGASTPAANAAQTPPAAPASNPFGSFNASKPAEAPKPAESKSAVPASFSFGAAQPSSGAFTFGQSDVQKSNGAVAPTGFGSTPASPAAVATPAFSFGAPAAAPAAAATPASFTFGAPAAASQGFGSTGAAAPSGGFGSGFGAAAATPAAPAAPAAAFTFGAAPPAVSGFGAAPAATSGFGAPAPSTSASTPGGFGSGFGFNQPAPTPPANNSGFQFGAAGNGAGMPATAPASSGSFTFGSSAPSNQTFQFGAGAPPATPAASAGGGGFNFGGPAPSGQVPRFGSPQPPVAGADGGFSMGMAEPAPGSPSGRRAIKPLRKAKR